jgi:hypothetical protein
MLAKARHRLSSTVSGQKDLQPGQRIRGTGLQKSPFDEREADCTQETELLAVLAQKLGLVRGAATATSLDHLQRLVSRLRNNNFSICDARLLPVGAGYSTVRFQKVT